MLNNAVGTRTWSAQQPPSVTLMSSAALKAAVTLISPFQVYTPDKLHQLMSESHYVVAALPSTTETEGYISAEAIASMRSDAVFINIGRGKTVDEVALIKGQVPHMLCSSCLLWQSGQQVWHCRHSGLLHKWYSCVAVTGGGLQISSVQPLPHAALQERRIKGAGLDVFATEPLPLDSPLWKLDNVLMSPHSACWTDQHEAIQQFVTLAEQYLAGQELPNQPDRKAGY